MKTHIRDIRLFNNAGISFAMCKLPAENKPLDLDAGTGLPMAHPDKATCSNCKRAYTKRYSWASSAR